MFEIRFSAYLRGRVNDGEALGVYGFEGRPCYDVSNQKKQTTGTDEQLLGNYNS